MIYKIVLTLFILTIAVDQTIATSLAEILSESEYKYKKVIIPSSKFSKNNMLELLSQIKSGDVDKYYLEDLSLEPEETKKIKDLISNLLSLDKTKEIIYKKKLEETHTWDIVANIFSHLKILQKKSHKLIEDCLKDQQDSLLWRLDRFINNAELIAQKNSNHFLIFVLPEAFFNFFNNPNLIGNFIPFHSKDIFFEKISSFSRKNSNALFVGNFVYASKESAIKTFSDTFDDFLKHSYNQSGIIKKYFAQKHRITEDPDAKMIPIFNESFILFKGEQILTHRKRFILDEDMPLEYLDSIIKKRGWAYPIYTPGYKDQQKLDDFYIEICQDHAMIFDKKKSKITFIQSASVEVNPERLKNTIDGLFVHSDIESKDSKVFTINPETKFITYMKKENIELNLLEILENRMKELELLGVDYVSSEFLCNLFWEKEEIKEWGFYDVSNNL